MTIQRHESGKRLSQVLVHQGVAFVSGQTADDLGQDITGQTQQVLASIDRLLELAGSSKSRILYANIWLRHGEHFDAMNKVWEAWIPAGCAPARATVGSPLVGPDTMLIEIALQAST
ncbi:RidA family protein [Paucibacter toxinivorans]|uniref:Enamine deaminase RidA (YjgF/YER057c/UK114 family) n=1 Tax=Roseateles toxinivorans TaxID=270368 RepID=A0A4R6QH77_9BURK|nr:enamine deaminase RidA (YjgF/YER057c/UK114 family) [Roseateles toxinivorans]